MGSTHNHLLIMAYGGPDSLADVRPYLLDVRNYRETSEEVFKEIEDRYELIGGRSPILELTKAEANGIEQALNGRAEPGESWKVWVGMRHWHPFIQDTLQEIQADGGTRIVGLVMAPHYSRMSIGAYFRKIEEASTDLDVVRIDRWHLNDGYLNALEDRVRGALLKFPESVRDQVPIVYTAHSLPERILEWNDPYPTELMETADAVSSRFPSHDRLWAYQSAAMTPDPWLGPDASEVIRELHTQGHQHVLVCPVGFVCEHVEILYDIDIEFAQLAKSLGMQLERIEMLNDHPEMIQGLAELVRTRAAEAGWLN